MHLRLSIRMWQTINMFFFGVCFAMQFLGHLAIFTCKRIYKNEQKLNDAILGLAIFFEIKHNYKWLSIKICNNSDNIARIYPVAIDLLVALSVSTADYCFSYHVFKCYLLNNNSNIYLAKKPYHGKINCRILQKKYAGQENNPH